MNMVPISSSTIAAVRYDNHARAMDIEFKNGSVYRYFDVPAAMYEELLRAGSAGQYLNSQIKGNFRYARM